VVCRATLFKSPNLLCSKVHLKKCSKIKRFGVVGGFGCGGKSKVFCFLKCRLACRKSKCACCESAQKFFPMRCFFYFFLVSWSGRLVGCLLVGVGRAAITANGQV